LPVQITVNSKSNTTSHQKSFVTAQVCSQYDAGTDPVLYRAALCWNYLEASEHDVANAYQLHRRQWFTDSKRPLSRLQWEEN
jgi:hypothetical protein